MKRIMLLLLAGIWCTWSFGQTQSTSYKAYINNLCNCYEKDSSNVNTMDEASLVLGKCMNQVDTLLRNKAMQEKGILNTDVEGLVKFEKTFATDLVMECMAFQKIIERLTDNGPKITVAKLPILDTVANNICNCLEARGVPATKAVATTSITECFSASVVKHYNKLLDDYKADGTQETLSAIGLEISKLMMTNCKFYLDKINPVLTTD